MPISKLLTQNWLHGIFVYSLSHIFFCLSIFVSLAFCLNIIILGFLLCVCMYVSVCLLWLSFISSAVCFLCLQICFQKESTKWYGSGWVIRWEEFGSRETVNRIYPVKRSLTRKKIPDRYSLLLFLVYFSCSQDSVTIITKGGHDLFVL